MIHTHSLGRAARFYPTRTALASAGAGTRQGLPARSGRALPRARLRPGLGPGPGQSGSGKILKRVLRERFWANQQRAVS